MNRARTTPMRHLRVDGVRLEAIWIGPPPIEAPTLVYLHEGLGSLSLWKDFPARVAEATGWGALVYSRRGYGRSDPLPPPWPITFMHEEAELLERVLDAAHVRDAVLVGHSDGASIALIHAATHPGGRVRGLVLEAPHVSVEEVTVRRIARLPEEFRSTGLPARLARHHGDNTESVFRGWTGVWLHPAFRAWSIERCLPRIRIPVLALQGRDDEYGTVRQLEAIQQQVPAPVEVRLLAECGHSVHRDQPEAVLEAIASFLAHLRRAPCRTCHPQFGEPRVTNFTPSEI